MLTQTVDVITFLCIVLIEFNGSALVKDQKAVINYSVCRYVLCS